MKRQRGKIRYLVSYFCHLVSLAIMVIGIGTPLFWALKNLILRLGPFSGEVSQAISFWSVATLFTVLIIFWELLRPERGFWGILIEDLKTIPGILVFALILLLLLSSIFGLALWLISITSPNFPLDRTIHILGFALWLLVTLITIWIERYGSPWFWF